MARISVRASDDLVDRVHDAVIFHKRKKDVTYSKRLFVTEALESYLRSLYGDMNKGRPFPKTNRHLGPGRPTKGNSDA